MKSGQFVLEDQDRDAAFLDVSITRTSSLLCALGTKTVYTRTGARRDASIAFAL